MSLSRRVLKVMCAIVELYIRSGGPVASRDVARFSGLGLSPATMRNIMAELEHAGYLSRPHASAGTIPSDRGLRLYVDSVSNRSRLSATAKRRLADRMAGMRRELVEDFAWVARLTADATNEAGLAVRPFGHGGVLEAVSLVALEGDRVLGLLITADGAVDKHLLSVTEEIPRARLQEISNFLSTEFCGLNLDEVSAALDVNDEQLASRTDPTLARQAYEMARSLLEVVETAVEVQVAGADYLLQTDDFAEIDRIRSLFATLDDGQGIVREIRRALATQPTQVIIGRESDVTASGDLGMVTTLFFKDGRRAGAIGIVGPRRMDYARIVPVVEYIGESLTKMLQEPGALNG